MSITIEAVEEDCNKITLKPASAFIGHWIKDKYSKDMYCGMEKISNPAKIMKTAISGA